MNVLCITPCGKRKIWDKDPIAGPTKAKDVYTGPFTRKCQEYAKKFYPNSWCILSAKYGFVYPDEIVLGPYNVTFNKRSSKPISVHELIEQATQKRMYRYHEIIVLGGKEYVRRVSQVFPNKELSFPISGLRSMFEMIGKLNNAINSDHKLR